MPAKLKRVWTREEVLALPEDGNRYELVDGELLVSPSPRWLHQRAVGELWSMVRDYTRAHRIGEALFSPADLDLRSEQLLQPDIFVAPLIAGPREPAWDEVGIPSLVVEVLSPSTAHIDRGKKRRRFQKSRVPTYWIVDVEARVVEVWTPGADRAVTEAGKLTWAPVAGIPALEIDLPSFFREVRQTL